MGNVFKEKSTGILPVDDNGVDQIEALVEENTHSSLHYRNFDSQKNFELN